MNSSWECAVTSCPDVTLDVAWSQKSNNYPILIRIMVHKISTIFYYTRKLSEKNQLLSPTPRDGRMSRATISSFGRSGDSELVSFNPGQVKPMTSKCIVVASKAISSAVLGYGKDWFVSVGTMWLRSCCWQPGLPVESYYNYKVIMSVHCHKSVPALIWP